MKNRNKRPFVWVVLLFCIFIAMTVSAYQALKKAEFMKIVEVERRWGKIKFDSEKFKSGDSQLKASMAASLLKSKAMVGVPLADVRMRLGAPTGYYFSDVIPAYAIGDLSKDRKETWQIVLIPDSAGKAVGEVKVHKKCCYK
jgi:hypothetical protein